MHKPRFRYATALFAALLIAILQTPALAAEDQIVINDLTAAQLRSELKRIQTEFYRVFNESIEDETLAINCYRYTPTGSNIREEACEPQFLIDARGQNVNDVRFNVDVLLNPQDLQARLSEEYEDLTAAMNKLAKESKYFRELNSILGALREELASR